MHVGQMFAVREDGQPIAANHRVYLCLRYPLSLREAHHGQEEPRERRYRLLMRFQ